MNTVEKDPETLVESLNWKVLVREKELWILVLLTLGCFYQPIVFGDVFFYRDLYYHFLPAKKLLVEILHQGNLPLWNPYLQGGEAFLANPNNIVLYPSNLLYLIMKPEYALSVDIIFHVVLCGIATYIFARLVGFSKLASFVAGCIYSASGVTFSLCNLLNWMLCFPYLPIMLCFWHLNLKQRKNRWFFLLVFAGCFQILAGAPEFSLITFATLFLWAIFYRYDQPIPKRLTVWFLALVMTTMIAAIQILPTLEILKRSARYHQMSNNAFLWSVSPKRLPEMIFPGFLGSFESSDDRTYWGEKISDGFHPFFLSIYFGPLVFLLSFAAIFNKRKNIPFPRSLLFILLFLALAGIVLSLGRNLPGYKILYSTVPGLKLFRYPVKFLTLTVLPFSLLAGLGLDTLRNNRYTVRILISCWIFLLLLCCFAVGFLTWKESSQFFFAESTLWMKQQMISSFARSCLVVLIVCILLQVRIGSFWKWQLLAGLLAADLLTAGITINTYAPARIFSDTPRLAKIIHSEIRSGRLYRSDTNPQEFIKVPSKELFWLLRWKQEILIGSQVAAFQIPIIFHIDQDELWPADMAYMKLVVNSIPWEKRLPLLTTAGVSLILTSQQLNVPSILPLAKIKNASGIDYFLYRNETFSNPVSFVTNWIFLPSRKEMIWGMLSPNFDPYKYVELEGPRSQLFLNHCSEGQIRMINQGFNSSEYEVLAPCKGYLVFSESFHPGWRAYIDGKRVPLLSANLIFSAIYLHPGKHRIRKEFAPFSFYAGCLISIVSVGLLTFGCLKKIWSRI